MKIRQFTLLAAAGMTLILAAGCSQGDSKQAKGGNSEQDKPAAAAPESKEPVKLLMAQKWSEITEADFKSLIVEPLKQKYPNIEIELLKGENIKEMIAAGTVPDLVAT
ncbi:hypothetical protein O9H85_04910 [Paenibacillus filicis]|uniref:Extracellular solute-binding protein n=1 Tax=Paenibacillus gyeongsangnamensis TaxID=3388067 RepID=A0ABT4Q4I5_9BACL|nr:hypothetical protein [Paenibacillus filicis]MCZ8511772.1 hypothetical protein [Paenibacillus filicis]